MLWRYLIAGIAGCILYCLQAAAQQLQPGFNPKEYEQLLRISAYQADTPWTHIMVPRPQNCELIYRSPVVGMMNRWDLWLWDGQTAVISIRGTVGKAESWLENFYAGMIPARGDLRLNDSTVFHYRLAADSNAYVHAGWTLGLASMAPDIVSKIKELHSRGIRSFVIMGHSQGGAISFLLRSYLQYLDDPGFPEDIVIKTYCSAAPKPGNLNYAYDFDFITRDGWAFRVVNTHDWVPETPFSVQSTSDFTAVNPFTDVKKRTRKQALLARLVINHLYGRLDGSTRRASRRMQRVLGKLAYKRVRKVVPGYAMPGFVNSHNYTPAGTPVILAPAPGYDEKFPFDGKDIFVHHKFRPYVYLLKQHYKLEE